MTMKEMEKEIIERGYSLYDESPVGVITYRKMVAENTMWNIVLYPDGSGYKSHCGIGRGCFAVVDKEWDSAEEFPFTERSSLRLTSDEWDEMTKKPEGNWNEVVNRLRRKLYY